MFQISCNGSKVPFLEKLPKRPEGAENIPLGSQVSDVCFKNPNCIRNPKMGSKQSITVPLKKLFSEQKNH